MITSARKEMVILRFMPQTKAMSLLFFLCLPVEQMNSVFGVFNIKEEIGGYHALFVILKKRQNL